MAHTEKLVHSRFQQPLRLTLGLHLSEKHVEDMFMDMVLCQNHSMSSISGRLQMQQMKYTLAWQMDDEKSFKVKRPSSKFKLLLSFHAITLFEDCKRQMKVSVLPKNGLRIAFAVKKYLFAWERLLEFWDLRPLDSSGQLYFF